MTDSTQGSVAAEHEPDRRNPWPRAALTSAGLSVLFVGVYTACNQFTATRADVGTCAFAWERFIPFVPLMIVPYMSIDAFFVAAPFVCRTEGERHRLAARIVMAILLAGLCFLLFPLRFAFPRPAATGALGALFDWFRAMDLPYNLAPSLHIALRTILVGVYVRHTRGAVRAGVHVWFSLIGFSTLLVWQHHVIDVAAGFLLAGGCCFVFPENERPRTVQPNRRVAGYYGVAAAALTGLAGWFRPWGALLLWPAFSCGVMAGANLRWGAAVFQKRAGALPWFTRIALAPVLAGQWLSLRHYRRQCRPWDEVAPGVWIGRVLAESEAEAAVARGVTAVLDLTGEFAEARAFRRLRYRNLPVLDLTAPSADELREMARFIADEAGRGTVYVHCKIGYSRSAAAAGAYLLHAGIERDVDAVLARLRAVRPSIVVRPEIVAALRRLAPG